jgi:exonuclease VII small subunit
MNAHQKAMPSKCCMVCDVDLGILQVAHSIRGMRFTLDSKPCSDPPCTTAPLPRAMLWYLRLQACEQLQAASESANQKNQDLMDHISTLENQTENLTSCIAQWEVASDTWKHEKACLATAQEQHDSAIAALQAEKLAADERAGALQGKVNEQMQQGVMLMV